MLTSKTIKTSTKHRKNKQFGWNLLLFFHFYIYKLKKRLQFQFFQKLTLIFSWKVSSVQVIINMTTFATFIYSLNITILTRFTNFYVQVRIEE